MPAVQLPPITAKDLAHPTLFPRPWDGSEWLFEGKHDGFRALVHKRDDQVTSHRGTADHC